jgi:hypothetical protein
MFDHSRAMQTNGEHQWRVAKVMHNFAIAVIGCQSDVEFFNFRQFVENFTLV